MFRRFKRGLTLQIKEAIHFYIDYNFVFKWKLKIAPHYIPYKKWRCFGEFFDTSLYS